MFLLITFIIILVCIIWFSYIKAKRFNEIYANAQIIKKKARATGSFHKSPYSLKSDFLDYMGQFFKHKKHEWVFIAFMKGNAVNQFWVNKGNDNKE